MARTKEQRAAHAAYMRSYYFRKGLVKCNLSEKPCRECGKEFMQRAHNQYACDPCRRVLQLKWKRESSKRSRAAKKTVTCVLCGSESHRTSSRQKTCTSCRKAYLAKLNEQWRARNMEKVVQIRRRHYKKRRADPIKRLNGNLSGMIGYSLKTKGGRSWESLVNFNLGELIAHLEPQFKDGMTWENYGEWHVDHVRPIASFRISKSGDQEFRACWSLSNLQPLWSTENKRKNSIWQGRMHKRCDEAARGVAV